MEEQRQRDYAMAMEEETVIPPSAGDEKMLCILSSHLIQRVNQHSVGQVSWHDEAAVKEEEEGDVNA